MRTRPGPVLLWLAATATAIAVASVAISQVGRQIALETPIDEQLAQAGPGADAGTAPGGEDADGAEVAREPAAEQTPDPADGASSDPDASSAAAEVRSYDTIGGSAAIAISGERLELLWATPRDGFRVSVEPSASGAELRVDFRSEAHRSRIKVELVGGRVVDGVEEDDR